MAEEVHACVCVSVAWLVTQALACQLGKDACLGPGSYRVLVGGMHTNCGVVLHAWVGGIRHNVACIPHACCTRRNIQDVGIKPKPREIQLIK